MKRIITTVLLLLLIVSAASAFAESFVPMQVDFCEEFVTLREKPSTSSDAVMPVNVGEVVMAAEWDASFCRCYYNGREGYILRKYLNESIHGYSEPYTFKVCNCRENISLRAFPLPGADVLTTIPLGAEISAVYHDGSYDPEAWVYVIYDGRGGFTRWKYLEYAGFGEGYQ